MLDLEMVLTAQPVEENGKNCPGGGIGGEGSRRLIEEKDPRGVTRRRNQWN